VSCEPTDSTDRPERRDFSKLDELLVAVIEGCATDEQIAELELALADDPAAQARYIRYIDLICALRKRHGSVGARADLPAAGASTSLSAAESEPDSDRDSDPEADTERAPAPVRFAASRPFSWRFAVSWALPAAAVLAIALVLVVGRDDEREVRAGTLVWEPTMTAAFSERTVGVVTHVWDEARFVAAPARAGLRVEAGRLQLTHGRIQLRLLSGVAIHLAAPCDVELESAWRLRLEDGELSARVPRSAVGFAVRAPGTKVVDLGTEFGLRVDGGVTSFEVFEGSVELTGFDALGESFTREKVWDGRALRVEQKKARLDPVDWGGAPPARVDRSFSTGRSAELRITREYVDTVLAAEPRIYWRFEEADGGVVVDRAGGAYDLHLFGPEIAAGVDGNHVLRFDDDRSRMAICEGVPALNAQEYSIELWVLPARFKKATLVSFHGPEQVGMGSGSKGRLHLTLDIVELNGPVEDLAAPNAVRFTHRWPPSGDFHAGVNIFSPSYTPGVWSHIVATKADRELRLYLNGRLVARGEKPSDVSERVFDITLGKIDKTRMLRQFHGLLDEFALYPRVLSEDEIRRHYALVTDRD